MATPAAARINDPIKHSFEFFGQVAGFVAGLAVAGALIIGGVLAAPFTGGMSLAASILAVITIAGLGETGAGIGGLIGKYLLPGMESGRIAKGARTVFIGPGRKNAARVRDPLVCQDPGSTVLQTMSLLNPMMTPAYLAFSLMGGSHAGAELREGSGTVKIEGQEASRVGDKTTCGGQVSKGSETVLIGGPKYSTGVGSGEEVPAWWSWSMVIIEWLNVFKDVKQFVKWGAKFLPMAYRILRNIPFRRRMLRLAQLVGKKAYRHFWDWYGPVGSVGEDVLERTLGKDHWLTQWYTGINDTLGGVKEGRGVRQERGLQRFLDRLRR